MKTIPKFLRYLLLAMGISEAAAQNLPPVADAGPDQTVNFDLYGQGIASVSGSASYDPEGLAAGQPNAGIVSFSWSGSFLGSPLQGPSPTLNFPITGPQTVTLTVTDAQGATATDSVTIDVFTPGPQLTQPAQFTFTQYNPATNAAEVQAWLANQGGAVAEGADVVWTNNYNGSEVPYSGAVASYFVTFTAQNANGVTRTANYFLVVDSQPPTVFWSVNGVELQGTATVNFARKSQPGSISVSAEDLSELFESSFYVISTTGSVQVTQTAGTIDFSGGRVGDVVVLGADVTDIWGNLASHTLTVRISRK